VLTPNSVFSKVNGYSNMYWGWGWQDVELRTRFMAGGIMPGRRRGRFLPLDHDNRGYTRKGTPTPIARVNEGLYRSKWDAGGQTENDGLSSLQFRILGRREIASTFDGERPARWEMVCVRIDTVPSPAHLEALGLPVANRLEAAGRSHVQEARELAGPGKRHCVGRNCGCCHQGAWRELVRASGQSESPNWVRHKCHPDATPWVIPSGAMADSGLLGPDHVRKLNRAYV
jgi:hypothetical protein